MPESPDLAQTMGYFPFRTSECANIIAEGYIKAGCPGQPSGYYKIYAENRLTKDEVRELISGHRHIIFLGNHPFWIDHSSGGKLKFEGFGLSFGGKWWIKDDMVCYRLERPDIKGLDDCHDTYRNPDSTPGSKKEYFTVADTGIYPFSIDR